MSKKNYAGEEDNNEIFGKTKKILFFEITVIIIIVIILALRFLGILNFKPSVSNQESAQEFVTETISNSYKQMQMEEEKAAIDQQVNEANDVLSESLNILIAGDYDAEGKQFSFDQDGTYNGYFDEEHQDTTGSYSFQMTDEGKYLVTITADKNEIKYYVDFDASGTVLSDMDGNKLYTMQFQAE